MIPRPVLASTEHTLLVLDSWPILEWLRERSSALPFHELLLSAEAGRVRLVLSRINLGEVFYSCAKHWGEMRAEVELRRLESLPMQFVDVSASDILAAARLKARFPISYADCFAAVLAIAYDCPVLTGDPDFLHLQKAGVLSVDWQGA